MILHFGSCELDIDRRELRDDGSLVMVEPQVFDVLAYLVMHRDRVVTKGELLDNVWGDRFVSESALTSRIKSARRAVGDSGQSQHVIRTMHGRGYRFVADVGTGSRGVDPLPTDGGPTAGGGLFAEGPPDAAAQRASAWPLLGRSPELGSIGEAFRDADTGGVLLIGPAGVGKTRLAQECVRLARDAGIPVARVSGHPETKSLPLAALAHLVPPEVAQPVGVEGELDRTRLFHRARAAIEQMTSGIRAMVLVDDVDQLDDLSRALMVSLVHARAVFVVVTLRTASEAADGSADDDDDGVGRLVKDGHLRALDVGPLQADTVEALIHRVLGAPMEDASLAQLVAASVGNPGVLRQLVETAWDAGNLVDRGGVWALDRRLAHAAPTLELLVQERLGGLGDDEREAVELLAVAGELALEVLAGLVDETVLERLEQRGLLQVSEAGGRTEAMLAHPLFAEVIRHQLPTIRGRRLRRTLADALSDTEDRADQVRIVAWRLEAGGHVDAGLLAEAARLALIDGDEAMAERILGRADSVDRTPEIVQLLAELKFRRGDTDAVEALLASIDVHELDEQGRARVLRRRATNLFYGRGQFPEGVDLLTRGLEELSEPRARQSLEAYHVLLLAMAGRVGEAIAHSDEPAGDLMAPARLELLRGRALALATAGRAEDALLLVADGWRIHASLAADLDRPGLSLLLFTEVLALAELGRLVDAEAAARRSLTRRADAVTMGWIALAKARLDLAGGQADGVARKLEPLVRTSRQLGHGATERWGLALVATAHLLRGDRARATENLRRVAELEDGTRGLFHTDIDRAHAWLTAEVEGRRAGCEKLIAAARDAQTLGKYGLEASLLHDVVRFGHAELVAARLAELAERSQGRLIAGRAAHAVGAAQGDPETLEEAVAMFEQSGANLFAAEVATQVVGCLQGAASRRLVVARERAARLREALADDITTPLLHSTE